MIYPKPITILTSNVIDPMTNESVIAASITGQIQFPSGEIQNFIMEMMGIQYINWLNDIQQKEEVVLIIKEK